MSGVAASARLWVNADLALVLLGGVELAKQNALVAFFRRLSFQTYREALTDEQARQLTAATLFDETCHSARCDGGRRSRPRGRGAGEGGSAAARPWSVR